MKFLKKAAAVIMMAALVFSFSACSFMSENASVNAPILEEGTMAVHFLDVGQGDSEFIELPNGETMLIDAGEPDMGKTVVEDIKALGYSAITYVVATHPHSDHIGGMAEVFYAFDIENVYLPDIVSSSGVYDGFLSAIEAENCNVTEAEAGVTVIDRDGITARFVAPVNSTYYEDLNNYSAVLKLDYGENSFLFMGDAEQLSEKEITADISADVIKVGHHGSRTSSSQEFVNRVFPAYAVFEVGKDNSYGHPHREVLERWQKTGAEILRTDENGTITIISDGKELSVKTESSGVNENITAAQTSDAQHSWVLNTNSKKIHTPDCASVKKISEENIQYTDKSLNELKEQGYTCCKSCNPGE